VAGLLVGFQMADAGSKLLGGSWQTTSDNGAHGDGGKQDTTVHGVPFQTFLEKRRRLPRGFCQDGFLKK
jgi:hypothetical protein